jgi:pyrimidine deaminase RibD-like protein
MITDRDIELTGRALDLAARGIGLVSPNPLVGCVVVSSDGEVVGEGTYIRDDVVHAEADGGRRAGLAQGLADGGQRPQSEAGAAVLSGDDEPAQFGGATMVVENVFRYSPFRVFSVDATVKFQ